MEYTNSPLVDFTQLSPNHSGERDHSIDRITPHCYVGQVTVERMGRGWASPGGTSANYGIGYDAKVGLYVEEKNRAWTSSSPDNDHRAVTIECASDSTSPYAFKDDVYNKLIDLCTDICKRNGKTKLLWFGNKTQTLKYNPEPDEMVLTVHRWFTSKSCPGNWMYYRMGDLATKVTERLSGSSSEVKKEETTETVKDNGIKYYVQVGAFTQKESADEMVSKLKAAGFDATIKTEEDTTVKQEVTKPAEEPLKVGDVVKLQKNAPCYGKTTGFSAWVYNATLYVREIKGWRVVISTRKTGAVTGAVDKKYLTKI